MNATKLSIRLENVTKYLVPGGILADIGSDHAYLPCFAIENKLVDKAIAGEVVKGPYLSAKSNVSERSLSSVIDVRLGSGLSVLQIGEADSITICGMGGALIAQILEEGKEKLVGKERLILQPNIHSEAVREWLLQNQWHIVAEEIVEEDEKIYEIVIAEKGEEVALSDAEKMMGPFLIKENSPVFRKKWQGEKEHFLKILAALETAQKNEKNEEKKQDIQYRISLIDQIN